MNAQRQGVNGQQQNVIFSTAVGNEWSAAGREWSAAGRECSVAGRKCSGRECTFERCYFNLQK